MLSRISCNIFSDTPAPGGSELRRKGLRPLPAEACSPAKGVEVNPAFSYSVRKLSGRAGGIPATVKQAGPILIGPALFAFASIPFTRGTLFFSVFFYLRRIGTALPEHKLQRFNS